MEEGKDKGEDQRRKESGKQLTEKLSSTIMKNLNTLKVNGSRWSNERASFNNHRLSSTIIDYHAPFDQSLKS